MNDIIEIVIHHSISPRDQTLDASINSFNITHKRRLHPQKNSLGYYIAYHYVIAGDGSYKQTRAHNEVGYHASNLEVNKRSIGICLTGNFDNEKPSQAQMSTLRTIVQKLKIQYDIEKINGHKAYAKKSCPGKNVTDKFINSLLTTKPMKKASDKSLLEIIKELPDYNQSEVEAKGNGDCVPYNVQLCGAIAAWRNYPGMIITVDHTFDERVRKLIGKREDSTGGMYADNIENALKEIKDKDTGKVIRAARTIDCDIGGCTLRFSDKSFKEVEYGLEIYKQQIRLKLPVLMGMTYDSVDYSKDLMKYDENPSNFPSKHQGTLLGFTQEGNGIWYDTSFGKDILKYIEPKLLDTKGNLRFQGIYKPYVIVPEVIIK